MAKAKFEYELKMSDNCHRSKQKKSAVLAWIKAKKAFDTGRKPTIAEFIRDALKPGTRLYKANVLEHNQKKAADKYYYKEAQYYLGHLQVIKINVKTREASPPIRAFIPIKFSRCGTVKEGDYASAKRVANDPSIRDSVLERAYRDLLAWKNRYLDYAEFLEVFNPVLKVINKLPEIKKSA